MIRIILGALVALLFLSMPAAAGATFPSKVQARAAHPDAYLAYRILDSGQRCWYVGAKPSKAKCEASMRPLKSHAEARKPKARTQARSEEAFRRMAMRELCGGACPDLREAEPWTRVRPPIEHTALTGLIWFWLAPGI